MGKSSILYHFPVLNPGHPHAGGEILLSAVNQRGDLGPSPRGWGNLMCLLIFKPKGRAIPTRVGKSSRSWAPPMRVSGHPHAGGEIASQYAELNRKTGPSPRGWGNRECQPVFLQWLRAIPTRVGKSGYDQFEGYFAAGHPHAGGEISMRDAQQGGKSGPSPRGWGNPGRHQHNLMDCRAIPTRVGKSTFRARCSHRTAGHPHAGGEIFGDGGTGG